jgi:hypothetical protein
MRLGECDLGLHRSGTSQKFLPLINDKVLCQFLTDDLLVGSLNSNKTVTMMFPSTKVLCTDCAPGCLAVLTSELKIYLIGANGVRTLSAIPADIHHFGKTTIKVEETSGSLRLDEGDTINYSACCK